MKEDSKHVIQKEGRFLKKKKEAYKGNLAGVESRVKNISCTASAEIERYSFISGFYHTYLSGG